MPTIPCVSGLRAPFFGEGTGFLFVVSQYPPTSYPFSYTPRATSELETIAYWLAESPVVGTPELISTSGISIGPAPTGAPERFEYEFTYSDIDINDLDSTERLGIYVSGNDYRASPYSWGIGASAPPLACIAEIIADGDALIFHAVAESYTTPKTAWFYPGEQTPVPITLWQFDFGDGIVLTTNENITVEAAGNSYLYRSAPVVLSEIPEGPFEVRVRVQDSLGAVSNWGYVTVLPPETVSLLGSFVDHAGTLFTAVNVDSDVVVSRFKTNTASREPLYALEGFKNPSLFKIDGSIYLSATDRATGIAQLFSSRDGGTTFDMPVTVLDATYKNVAVSPLVSGGAVAVGIKASKVWFARSNNLTDWPSPVEIAPLAGSKAVQVHQKAISGSSALVASDGTKLAISRDGGKTWQAL